MDKKQQSSMIWPLCPPCGCVIEAIGDWYNICSPHSKQLDKLTNNGKLPDDQFLLVAARMVEEAIAAIRIRNIL